MQKNAIIKLIDRKGTKARQQTKWRPQFKVLERVKSSIHSKLDRFNEKFKFVNQSTSNWTFVQHKIGITIIIIIILLLLLLLLLFLLISRQLLQKEDYKPELKSHI